MRNQGGSFGRDCFHLFGVGALGAGERNGVHAGQKERGSGFNAVLRRALQANKMPRKKLGGKAESDDSEDEGQEKKAEEKPRCVL